MHSQRKKTNNKIVIGTLVSPLFSVSCQIAALGVESGLIPDAQLTAFSQADENHSAHRARLNMQKEGRKRGGWVPRSKNLHQWLQVDLGSVNIVTAAATQGRSDYTQYVKKYKLQYSQDGNDFLYYRETGQTEDKVTLFNFISLFSEKCIIKQLLNEVEHDIMNYQNLVSVLSASAFGFGR